MVNFPPSLKLNRRNFGKLLRKSGETVLLCDQFYTVQVTRTTLLKVVFSSFNFACSLSPPCSPSIPKPTRKRRMDFTTWFSNKCRYGVMCRWPLATSSRRQTCINSSIFFWRPSRMSSFTALLREKMSLQSAYNVISLLYRSAIGRAS